MRYLVLSDIHANLEAFTAVLADARRARWDAVAFLGDAVGYGSRPEECLQLLRSLKPVVCLLGNHDTLLLGSGRQHPEKKRVNSVVEQVLMRHREELSGESLEFLATFTPSFTARTWQAVHGALRTPWEYMDTLAAARENEPWLKRPVCLFGHTHVPAIYAALEHDGQTLWRAVALQEGRGSYRLAPGVRTFFNPGSVGQPRDGNPAASYGVFDTDTRQLEVRRVAYDTEAARADMLRKDYPAVLADRLRDGH